MPVSVSEWVALTDGLSCAQSKVRWGALWTSRRDGDMLWSAYVVLMFQTCWRHCGSRAVSSTLRSWPPPTPTGITVSVSAFIPCHCQCRQLPGVCLESQSECQFMYWVIADHRSGPDRWLFQLHQSFQTVWKDWWSWNNHVIRNKCGKIRQLVTAVMERW